ncbi:periplasmic heavy metal sensor [Roseivirga sp. UBA838]|uniref:Spy/CpxP family protein refolding chaperone n=1 Tax=Roseivirga sp. UBA838 TaxID=1947393 RepID=UPI00257D595F|nr:periplasmic heavy metal sensor [Roseivirga sp. UBA838]|tara:strand:+ start:19858 stop:20343 length:486 start_codon:yes stop_codon:yes gene_type:complete
MKSSRIIGIAVVFLAVLNVVLLTLLWWGKPDQRIKNGMEGLLILEQELGLTDEQLEQLKRLRHNHFIEVNRLRDRMHEAREQLHGLYGKPEVVALTDSLSRVIGDSQARIEQATFNHFMKIRDLCAQEQVQVFDAIIMSVLKQGAPHSRMPPPQKKKRRGP